MIREYKHDLSHIPPKSTDSFEVRRQDDIHQKISKLEKGAILSNRKSLVTSYSQPLECLHPEAKNFVTYKTPCSKS